jgi:hypothetical protein
VLGAFAHLHVGIGNETRSNLRRIGKSYAPPLQHLFTEASVFTKHLSILGGVLALTACSAVGQLTVKDYRSASGERVMVGQAEPKGEYNCQQLAQDKQEWGFKGNMDRAGAMQRVTSAAVDAAPGKGANYAYIMAPAEKSIGGFNVNAWSDAEVAYYKCASLPPAST